jgi:DNA replication protein DnaC
MFSLVSNRYERASMIVTSNKPLSAWSEIFGDGYAAKTSTRGLACSATELEHSPAADDRFGSTFA